MSSKTNSERVEEVLLQRFGKPGEPISVFWRWYPVPSVVLFFSPWPNEPLISFEQYPPSESRSLLRKALWQETSYDDPEGILRSIEQLLIMVAV
jgi:hypothetical protein